MSFDTFQVSVLEARHLASMDKSGTSDPYCILKSSFNKQSFKTKVIKKNLTPHWDQSFSFFTSKPEGQIWIKLMDKDKIFKDEAMGEVVLNLQEFSNGDVHDKWFTLQNEPVKKKKDPSPGEIHLRLHYTGSHTQDNHNTNNNNAASTTKGKTEKHEEDKKDKQSTSAASTSTAPTTTAPKSTPVSAAPASIEEKYDLGKIIGRGAFSVVKEGIRKASGKKYAVKCISKKLIDKKELQLLEREIDIMKKLQHPHIIQLMEVIDTPDTLFLVLEFVSGGELFDAIVNKGSYSEGDAAKICKQILEAIQYIHALGIAHRDLKPENLLLAGTNDPCYPPGLDGADFIKIADFGLSKDFGEEQLQTSCGTPDYVAPEVLMGEPYDMSVDIWSIGVITYVLLCGFPPFYGETQKELFENIMSGNFDFPDPEWSDVSDAAKSFIKKILVVDAEERYTAEQCLNDPWIMEFTAPSNAKNLKRLQSFSVAKFKQYNEKYKEANQKPGYGQH